MDINQKMISKKRRRGVTSYQKVDDVLRIKLLNMVNEDQYMLKDAAKMLGINYSTAKTILRIWRIEKRIHKKYSSTSSVKKKRQHKYKKRATFPPEELNICPHVVGFNFLNQQQKPRPLQSLGNSYKVCKNTLFTIDKNNGDSTNCSSDVMSNNYSWTNWVLVYYVRMMQKGIAELEVIKNKYIIDCLTATSKSMLEWVKYNQMLLLNKSSFLPFCFDGNM
jgi:hypothetical protein